MRATTPGTAITLTHDPDQYTPRDLRLLWRVVRALHRGVFHYTAAP